MRPRIVKTKVSNLVFSTKIEHLNMICKINPRQNGLIVHKLEKKRTTPLEFLNTGERIKEIRETIKFTNSGRVNLN